MQQDRILFCEAVPGLIRDFWFKVFLSDPDVIKSSIKMAFFGKAIYLILSTTFKFNIYEKITEVKSKK